MLVGLLVISSIFYSFIKGITVTSTFAFLHIVKDAQASYRLKFYVIDGVKSDCVIAKIIVSTMMEFYIHLVTLLHLSKMNSDILLNIFLLIHNK